MISVVVASATVETPTEIGAARDVAATALSTGAMGFYLPYFNSNRGATIGLTLSGITTTVWYLLDNPFGIDNMYIAIIVPFIVLVLDRLISSPAKKESNVEAS